MAPYYDHNLLMGKGQWGMGRQQTGVTAIRAVDLTIVREMNCLDPTA